MYTIEIRQEYTDIHGVKSDRHYREFEVFDKSHVWAYLTNLSYYDWKFDGAEFRTSKGLFTVTRAAVKVTMARRLRAWVRKAVVFKG